MAARQFQKVLIDSLSGEYVPHWEIDAQTFGEFDARGDWALHKSVLVGGRQHGVDVITLDNGRFSIEILPTRGMGIQEGWFDGIRLGWDSPVSEVVHPQFINLEDRNGLGWLRGFSEWFVRCGMTHVGAPCQDETKDNQGRTVTTLKTLHGRVANTPASAVAVTIDQQAPYTIAVHGMVIESSMFGENLRLDTTISTEPGADWIRVQDSITNLGSMPAEAQMLYHINYGPPLLEEGSKLLVAADWAMPRDAVAAEDMKNVLKYAPPTTGLDERCYFLQPRVDRKGYSLHGMTNAAGDLAISHTCLAKALPHLTIWKNEAALEDGYVTGLEPGICYPNPVAFERKKRRVLKLKSGKSWQGDITLQVHEGKKSVNALKKRIKSIQGRKPIDILKAPDPKYSA